MGLFFTFIYSLDIFLLCESTEGSISQRVSLPCLEKRCLMTRRSFPFHLDLYFTRVTPSGTFDILKDDFDHWFIGCVLLALFLGSAIAKKLARHRDVKMAWR